jgi:hypothetical protein
VKASCSDAIEKSTRFALYGVCSSGVLSFYSSIFLPCFSFSCRGQLHGFLSLFFPSTQGAIVIVRLSSDTFFLFFCQHYYRMLCQPPLPLPLLGFRDSKRGLMYIVSYGTCAPREACDETVSSWLWWIWLQFILYKSQIGELLAEETYSIPADPGLSYRIPAIS